MDDPNALGSPSPDHDHDHDHGRDRGGHDARVRFCDGMSPGEHFVYLYRDDDTLLGLVERFVAEGLQAGDATMVIATPEHLAALERRLGAQGLDLVAARWQGQYLPMDARATLRQFMLPTGPDLDSFVRVMGEVLRRARRTGRGVRCYGEMVALLLADGQVEATIQLERMWNSVCANESLPLFCAYPQSAFDDSSAAALSDICGAHSRLIAA